MKLFYTKNDYEKKLVSVELFLILLSFSLFVLGWRVHYKVQKAIDMELRNPKGNEKIIKYSKIENGKKHLNLYKWLNFINKINCNYHNKDYN